MTLDKLFDIIKSNRKIKDVLIKTNENEIRSNNCRIGFRLYQMNLETKNRGINDIVDQNTLLINRLSNINKRVEVEIDKLFNR